MNQSQNPSSIKSKKEITDALLKLMLDHPYQEISVKQIILETDLARRTFYRNYESKDDVLDSIITDKITEYAEELTINPESPLDVIFRFCEKNKDFLMLLHKNSLLYLLLLKLNIMIPTFNQVTDRSNSVFAQIVGNLEPDYLIAFNVGAIWNVIFKWVERGMTDSADEIKETIAQYLSRMKPFS
jgi:AcrR family transcriptional regulator